MRAVDTNVLVRLLAQDDSIQVGKAENFIRSGAWVSHLVLMEAVWVLKAVYGVSAAQLAAGVELLINHERLVVQEPEVVLAALALFRRKNSAGFSDCLLLEVARRAGHLPLGTFDKNLAKLEGVERL